MFLVLSSKTNILLDESIFFKSFPTVSLKFFFVSRNFMFSMIFKTSSSQDLNSQIEIASF